MPRFEMSILLALENDSGEINTEEYDMICWADNPELFTRRDELSQQIRLLKVQVKEIDEKLSDAGFRAALGTVDTFDEKQKVLEKYGKNNDEVWSSRN